METNFDTIIEKLDNIRFDDFIELNQIKPIAIEFLERTFGADCEAIRQIRSIRFKGRPGNEFWGTPGDNPIERWKIGIATFRGIILSKKETHEIKIATSQDRKIKP
jgi:hypothetical protein